MLRASRRPLSHPRSWEGVRALSGAAPPVIPDSFLPKRIVPVAPQACGEVTVGRPSPDLCQALLLGCPPRGSTPVAQTIFRIKTSYRAGSNRVPLGRGLALLPPPRGLPVEPRPRGCSPLPSRVGVGSSDGQEGCLGLSGHLVAPARGSSLGARAQRGRAGTRSPVVSAPSPGDCGVTTAGRSGSSCWWGVGGSQWWACDL